VAEYRQLPGLRVLAGVEAKILDTSGKLGVPAGLDLARYRTAAAQIQQEESQLAGLIRGYQTITPLLAATEAAERAWLTRVAAPQLTAAARGDFGAPQRLQADVAQVRP